MPVSTDDYVAVSDLLGNYCWKVDEGDADEWIKLWTEDGTFAGATPEPLVGPDQLKIIVALSNQSNGKMRHMMGNLHCCYGETEDTILARFYNFVTDWTDGGSFKVLAVCNAIIVRIGEDWKVKRNDARLLAD
ncbi:MAG: nuclear transport factor 2 family protein [Micavibrio sp.]|nr:nuclear transport factor 2 family protein [Micavibrio sp.]